MNFMYMAYSQSSAIGTLQGKAHASKGVKIKRGNTKFMLRFILIAVILGTLFSFGAIVQAYAGEGSTVTSVTSAPLHSVQTSSNAPVVEKVVIQNGDTLWDIASAHIKSRESVRSYVKRLKAVNHLSTSSLKEGQVLVLP
jgi:LysM repeat protein